MAWRLRLAPEKTSIDFFKHQWLTFGGSVLMMLAAFIIWAVMGLNYGIDFKGGTTIRTESATPVDVGAMRQVRTRPIFSVLTSPACSSTDRCCITAGSDIDSGFASSVTDSGPRASCTSALGSSVPLPKMPRGR